jgi:hypothetical protein
MDDNIGITFHSSDALETATKKTKLDIEAIQLPKLMGEPFPRLTPITLQQGVFQGPIWDPIENPAFWYHEGMLVSSTAPKTDLNKIQECLEELRHLKRERYLGR